MAAITQIGIKNADNTYSYTDIATAKSLTFNNSGSGADSNTTFNGSVDKTISYNTIGASPKNHASTDTTYGVASSENYGHVKIGDGINVNNGTISVDKEISAMSADDYNALTHVDSETTYLIDDGSNFKGASISHQALDATYGLADSTYYGHVKLSDIYYIPMGTAKTGVAASQQALYDCYNELISKINQVKSMIN